MLKWFRCGERLFSSVKNGFSKRSFLTESYACTEAWNRRIESPLLKEIKSEEMFYELENKFLNHGKVSAIDIDIFANTVKESFQIGEVMNILRKLRLTTETSNTLDSTHHAVIRLFLSHNCFDELFEVLNDRLAYGIFPDYLCYNILMDTFIKRKDFASAAKVASLLMLQEDSSNPISNALSVYSCHKFLEKADDWKEPIPKEDTSEEVKVRVKYIRNPYFDDHFDLTNPLQIVGKTLLFQGKRMNDSLGRTCQLRGLILFKKYKEAIDIIKKWLLDVNAKIVYEEVFELIKIDNAHILEDQTTDDFKNLQDQLSILKESDLEKGNLIEAIENLVTFTVEQQAEKDIVNQEQIYLKWEESRTTVLQEQLKLLDRERRLKNIESMKKDLQSREQLLTFFENEEEIELKIEEKLAKDKENYEELIKKPKALKKLKALVATEEYVPPNV